MPTEINGYSPSDETVLSSLVINEVDSSETFEKMKEAGLLQDNQLYLVTDEEASAGIDEVPTEGSKNLVYSGGVYDALKQVGSADSVIEQNKGLEQKFWRGTKEEFNSVEEKSDDTMYIITDEEGNVTGGSEIFVGPEAPETGDFWIDTDEEGGGASGGGSGVAIGDEEPTDGATVWIDTDAELSGGGSSSIAIQAEQPTDGSELWVDIDDEEEDEPSGEVDGSGIHVGKDEPTGDEQVWIDMDDSQGSFYTKAETDAKFMPINLGVTMTKLWENPNPTSEFSEQTLSVNTEGYDAIIVSFYGATSKLNNDICPDCLIMDVGRVATNMWQWSCKIAYRWVEWLSRSEIKIYDAQRIETYAGDRTNINNTAIPWKIYGIKGVR